MKKLLIVVILASALIPLTSSFGKKANKDEVELGQMLFSDPILSSDYTISCASCHIPAFAFADTAAVSTGVFGRKGKRNSPSAMNVLLRRSLFWDGRANTLEEQALAPIGNPDEMDLSLESAVYRLQRNEKYLAMFNTVYKAEPNRENLAAALAAFERTLETSESPLMSGSFPVIKMQ